MRTRDKLDKRLVELPGQPTATFCVSSIAGFEPTYSELATCLEMKRDLAQRPSRSDSDSRCRRRHANTGVPAAPSP